MKKLTLVLAALAAGCSPTLNTVAKTRPRPEWVARGGGIFQKDGNVVYYGVGTASAMPNYGLKRKAADARAREAVAASLKTSVQSLLKDFMEHNADYFNPGGKASSEELVNYVSSSTTDAELSNCRIVDTWEDPESGELHAIAKLDLKDGFYGSYKANLEKALRPGGPAADIKGADKALKQLDKQMALQRGKAGDILGAKANEEEPKIEPMKDPVAE